MIAALWLAIAREKRRKGNEIIHLEVEEKSSCLCAWKFKIICCILYIRIKIFFVVSHGSCVQMLYFIGLFGIFFNEITDRSEFSKSSLQISKMTKRTFLQVKHLKIEMHTFIRICTCRYLIVPTPSCYSQR